LFQCAFVFFDTDGAIFSAGATPVAAAGRTLPPEGMPNFVGGF